MTILITGVAGLIGSRLADYIAENTNHTVIGIDDLSGGYIENVNENVKFFQRDLSYDDISDIFKTHNIDVVYHFACYAAEGLSPFMRNFNYRNNILATTNIVNNCINFKVKRLVYASSMSVYGHGKKNGEIFDETLPYAPKGGFKKLYYINGEFDPFDVDIEKALDQQLLLDITNEIIKIKKEATHHEQLLLK